MQRKLFQHSLIVAALATPAMGFAAELIDVSTLPTPRSGLAGGDIRAALGVADDDLVKESSTRLPSGTQVTRYQQYYKGVRVWGEAITEAATGSQPGAPGDWWPASSRTWCATPPRPSAPSRPCSRPAAW